MGTLSLHCALTTTPTRRRKLPHPLHYYPSLAPPGGRLSSSTSSDIEEKPGVMCVCLLRGVLLSYVSGVIVYMLLRILHKTRQAMGC